MSSALSTKKARTFEDGTTPPAQPYSVQNLRGSIAQSSAGDSLPHMSKAEKRAPKTRLPSDCTAGTRARTLDTTQWHTDNCGKHTCHATCNCKHALPTSARGTPGSHFVPSKGSPRSRPAAVLLKLWSVQVCVLVSLRLLLTFVCVGWL